MKADQTLIQHLLPEYFSPQDLEAAGEASLLNYLAEKYGPPVERPVDDDMSDLAFNIEGRTVHFFKRGEVLCGVGGVQARLAPCKTIGLAATLGGTSEATVYFPGLWIFDLASAIALATTLAITKQYVADIECARLLCQILCDPTCRCFYIPVPTSLPEVAVSRFLGIPWSVTVEIGVSTEVYCA